MLFRPGYESEVEARRVVGVHRCLVVGVVVVNEHHALYGVAGFEEVAEKVMKYDEVESVYLMSGGYDLNVVVKGKTLQDIARFVARELATIDSVTQTSTHFVMRRYKEMDVELVNDREDDRGQLWI